MFMDIPSSWFQSLSSQDILELLFCTCVLFLASSVATCFCSLILQNNKVFLFVPFCVIIPMSVVTYVDMGDWNNARTKGLPDLKTHGFVISKNDAIYTFSLKSPSKQITAYSIGLSPKRILNDISGDVHLLSTTKDFHYSTYFTVDGQNDGHGKPIVWRTSTANLLRGYGHLVQLNQKQDKLIKDDEAQGIVDSRSFENSHKIK